MVCPEPVSSSSWELSESSSEEEDDDDDDDEDALHWNDSSTICCNSSTISAINFNLVKKLHSGTRPPPPKKSVSIKNYIPSTFYTYVNLRESRVFNMYLWCYCEGGGLLLRKFSLNCI